MSTLLLPSIVHCSPPLQNLGVGTSRPHCKSQPIRFRDCQNTTLKVIHSYTLKKLPLFCCFHPMQAIFIVVLRIVVAVVVVAVVAVAGVAIIV
jgi:hypothetical protein